MGSLEFTYHPVGLAQWRLSWQTHGGTRGSAKLCHFHRARQSECGPRLPVLGYHVAGLQSLAESVRALRQREGALVLRAGSGCELRPALREILPDSRRAAVHRLGRMVSLGIPVRLL